MGLHDDEGIATAEVNPTQVHLSNQGEDVNILHLVSQTSKPKLSNVDSKTVADHKSEDLEEVVVGDIIEHDPSQPESTYVAQPTNEAQDVVVDNPTNPDEDAVEMEGGDLPSTKPTAKPTTDKPSDDTAHPANQAQDVVVGDMEYDVLGEMEDDDLDSKPTTNPTYKTSNDTAHLAKDVVVGEMEDDVLNDTAHEIPTNPADAGDLANLAEDVVVGEMEDADAAHETAAVAAVGEMEDDDLPTDKASDANLAQDGVVGEMEDDDLDDLEPSNPSNKVHDVHDADNESSVSTEASKEGGPLKRLQRNTGREKNTTSIDSDNKGEGDYELGSFSTSFTSQPESEDVVVGEMEDDPSIDEEGLGEALTSLNILLFEAKVAPYTLTEFNSFKKPKKNSPSLKASRKEMCVDPKDHGLIVGSSTMEPQTCMSVKLFADLLYARTKHLKPKMERVDCSYLVQHLQSTTEDKENCTFLIQAVAERKRRPPRLDKKTHTIIPYIIALEKAEIDEKFDGKYEISIDSSVYEFTNNDHPFFTNNLRTKKGYLDPSPNAWLNLDTITGQVINNRKGFIRSIKFVFRIQFSMDIAAPVVTQSFKKLSQTVISPTRKVRPVDSTVILVPKQEVMKKLKQKKLENLKFRIIKRKRKGNSRVQSHHVTIPSDSDSCSEPISQGSQKKKKSRSRDFPQDFPSPSPKSISPQKSPPKTSPKKQKKKSNRNKAENKGDLDSVGAKSGTSIESPSKKSVASMGRETELQYFENRENSWIDKQLVTLDHFSELLDMMSNKDHYVPPRGEWSEIIPVSKNHPMYPYYML
eukprot:scaffold93202_cov54-Attheya_sp.AAC.1